MNLVIYYTSYFRYSTAISILMQEVQSKSIPYYISRVMFCGVKQVAKLLMISSLGTHDGFLSVDSHETVKVVVTERAIKQIPNTVLCFM